jgi:hypothetical protein
MELRETAVRYEKGLVEYRRYIVAGRWLLVAKMLYYYSWLAVITQPLIENLSLIVENTIARQSDTWCQK